MDPKIDLPLATSSHRSQARLAAPVLIQVPALRRTVRKPPGRRRRRLRREVRFGGVALLIGLTTIGAAQMVWRERDRGLEGASAASAHEFAPPRVSLLPHLEPVGGFVSIEYAGPVARPMEREMPPGREEAREVPDDAGS